jgi:hypothetical protein
VAGRVGIDEVYAEVLPTEASDLTLVRADLLAAPAAIRLARRTLRTIQGNLFWAFAYNVAAIPLAAAGLLEPMIAGITMALSPRSSSPTACTCAASGRSPQSRHPSQPFRSLVAFGRHPARPNGDLRILTRPVDVIGGNSCGRTGSVASSPSAWLSR